MCKSLVVKVKEHVHVQVELKEANNKVAAAALDLENSRRQCKVHELEARDTSARAQQSGGDCKRAQQEAARLATALDKATAQRTVLQQQLKECQDSVTVCMKRLGRPSWCPPVFYSLA